MNCTVKLKDILEAVTFCLQFVSKKLTKFNHVQFTIRRKTLTAYAFDGSCYAKHTVPCTANNNHVEFMLNADLLQRFLSVCQADELVIMCDDHYIPQVTFQDNGNKYEFKTFDTLLPGFPEVEADSTVLPDSVLKLAKLLAAATEKDSDRFQLAGIRFRFNDGDMTVATSDGRRICIVRESCSPDIEGEVLVPSDVIRRLHGLTSLSMSHTKSMVKFKNDSTEVCALVLQGAFPNIDKLIEGFPAQSAARTFGIEDFRSAIRKAAIVCDSDNPTVNINIAERHCIIKAEDTNSGKSEISIDFDRATGESNLQFAVNHKFVLAALDNIDALNLEDGKLIYRDKHSPVRLELGKCLYEISLMNAS